MYTLVGNVVSLQLSSLQVTGFMVRYHSGELQIGARPPYFICNSEKRDYLRGREKRLLPRASFYDK